MRFRFIFFLIPLLFIGNLNAQNNKNKPNIIFIYADDLGIGMLGNEGQEIVTTPNIDKLADEGIKFTNVYSNMLCSPARASLISGKHDCHSNGFEITNSGIYAKITTGEYTFPQVDSIVSSHLSPIPDEAVFLGQVAKEAGYKTAQFGKLEWGFASTVGQMTRHGWDHYLGYLDHKRCHGYYPPFLFEDGKLVYFEGNTRADCGKSIEHETPETYAERWDMTGKKIYSQDIFMDSIVSFITKNKDNPFFLYFPTQLPHGPVSIPKVHPDFVNNSRLTEIEKEYASMVKLLDDNVGQIIDTLKKLGIEDNTIVIFAADNGHEIYYTQEGRVMKPYRNMKTGQKFDNFKRKYYSNLAGDVFNGNGGRAGMKRSNLQGGIRVPLIIKWPASIKKGRTSDLLIANYDILPTIAEITGYNKTFNTDGISFYNELIGKKVKKTHDFVVYSSYYGPTLITKDGWKIRTYMKKNAFELYFLPDDFKEEHNLAQKYPDKLKELKSKLLEACDGDFNNGWYSKKKQIKVE